MIKITKHALEQYRSRILNTTLNDKSVINLIKDLFYKSRYISDNENGILFRNEDIMIEFIIKQNKIITLYPIQRRENVSNKIHRTNINRINPGSKQCL